VRAEPARVEVGRVGRAHGVRGEVSVSLLTNRPERVAPGAVLYADDRRLVVTAARPHQARWVVRFHGVADRTQAEALTGTVLTAERTDDAPDGEVWLDALIGAEVRDRSGRRVGVVAAIEANPAHDLLVLDGGGLVPVVFVVDYGPDAVVVDVPEGLLDVNRRDPPPAGDDRA
jgi:16S rRNA processing protein RimM